MPLWVREEVQELPWGDGVVRRLAVFTQAFGNAVYGGLLAL